jgi:hypothetical protein
MAASPSKRLVHVFTLLQMFKELGYERAIIEKRARAGTPYKDDPGPSYEPAGTRSQVVPYFIMGTKIALCHQYLRPDGTIGASGLPDPKLVEYRGYVLFCHSLKCDCSTCSAPPENWRTVIDQMGKL